jgi:hypothetical protein
MSSLLARPTTTAGQLLARILDEAALVAEVQRLPPLALAKLIDHVGLEDAGEIVQLATAAQIERVFDEDLWTSRAPGEDEVFDASRFVVWLEILLEAGESAAARRLAELPEDVVTLAFQRLVVFVDVDELASDLSEGRGDDGDAVERALEGSLTHEIGSFMVIARRHDGWDAIVTALVALDEEDHGSCARLLERCAAMSSREAEEHGGLSELLTDEETLAADVAGDRADRRASEGFVAPSDARSFLRLARSSTVDEIMKTPRDPVTRAYFRELDRAPRSETPPAPRLLGLLQSAGVLAEPSARRALPALRAKPGATTLSAALASVAEARAGAHAERMEELAFLVNVLVAGESFDEARGEGGKGSGRPHRPGEAAEAVVAYVNTGLAYLTKTSSRSAAEIIQTDGVVMAFRVGLRLSAVSER